MKKAIYLLAAVLVMLSCQNNKNYTITGNVADAGYEGTNVYLQRVTDDGMEVTDTAVVTNGAFSFEGVADSIVMRFVALDETVAPQSQWRVPVLVEPGNIEVKFDSVVTVTGTKVNDAYTNFRAEQNRLNNEARSVVEQYNSASAAGTMTDSLDAEINRAYDRISAEMDSTHFEFIKGNIQNELGKYLFGTSATMFDFEQQKEIIALTDDAYKARPNIARVISRIENSEKVAVGQPFVDFTMKDPLGNDVSLSDYAGKGKYVLIDFWAAWCGPCRREMPNLVAAYEKYKDKGFEIVGVSLDRDQESWVKGLSDLNMTWPQMSELKFWQSEVVDLYAFNAIPHMVLLDKEGIIIEKNLHGKKLQEKLEELLAAN